MEILFKFDPAGAQKKIADVGHNLAHLEPALNAIGLYVMSSVDRNFAEGGRPIRWKPSQRAIDQNGLTLVDKSRLRGSITKKVSGDTLTVGTNVKYAAIHHFGGDIEKEKKVKVIAHYRYLRKMGGYKKDGKTYYPFIHRPESMRKVHIKMPARPYLMLQDEDIPIIKRITADHIISGVSGTGGAA